MILSGAAMVVLTFAQIGPVAWHHRRLELERDRVLGQALSVYGQTAIKTYEQGGLSALREFSGGLEKSSGIALFLFKNGIAVDKTDPVISGLEARAEKSKGQGPVSEAMGKGYLLAVPLAGPQRQVYAVAGRWSYVPFGLPGPHGLFQFIFGFRLLVSLIIGGIICYGLAWHLTRPVRRLREATHQLAAGNLKARVGAALGERNDEIGALGRDFDGMAERIESLLGAQRRLIRDISHELRSPLARLRVALELARRDKKIPEGAAGREEAGGPDEANGPLDRIERETERLNALIAELVTLTLLESGTERLEKTRVEVNLSELVREIAEDAEYEAGGMKRSVKVLSNTDGREAISVFGSPEMLRRAIENVVRNALRYTPEGGSVEITTGRLRENGRFYPGVFVRVRDHGPGVPEDALKMIFQPFYRAGDTARDRLTGGAGIGLAITERAVHLHGGEVSASNAPGGGLLVEICLPENTNTPEEKLG